MARNRVPAKPSPVRTPSPKHWTSPQTHCSPSVREQTRMLFIIGRSLFVLCQDYCCKHLSFLERWGEEATDGTCTTNGGSILTNVPLYDRSRTKRTLQQQVLVRTKTAIRTSNKIPTAIHTPRSTRISLKISSPTMFSQH